MRRICPELGYAATMAEAAQDAQVVLLLTDWPEFARLRPGSLNGVVARRNIVDGRNVLDPTLWRDAGWNYRALGTAKDQPPQKRSAVRRSMTSRVRRGSR
jgi:UDPglucose 6-dehydrogenase